MNTHHALPRQNLFGVHVHAVTMEQTLNVCRASIEARRPLTIGVVNAAKLVAMSQNPTLREAVMSSDLVLADGMAVVWGARLLRRPLPERIAGIDLFLELLRMGDQLRWSAYFLGATQSVLDAVIKRVRTEFPGLRVAGTRNGYFRAEQSPEVADNIARSQADMLFVAITSPKKELFLGEFGRKLGVSVCHGVGGSFDVFAGLVRRAPRIWQRFGLEWLFRVVQEPRRLWKRYLVTNTLFAALVFRELCAGGSRHRKTSPQSP